MSKMRPITWALLAGLGVWFTWDVWCVVHGYPGTISRVVWDNMGKNPFISFMSGVSIGHLFWPQYRTKPWIELAAFGFFVAFMCFLLWAGRP